MLTLTYGTRPEYLKILPIIRELNKQNVQHKICKILQHTDLIQNCDYDLGIGINQSATGNRLNNIISSVITDSMLFRDTSYILVQGDTTSALAVAISAFNNKIPVIHLEAGLRTFDKNNPYPEEINRQLISRIADVHLCPTEMAKTNLLNENITQNVYVVGNTSIDNIRGVSTTTTNSILITLHRRENKPILGQWLTEIEHLANLNQKFNFTIITHPSIDKKEYDILKQVKTIEPLSHHSCLELLRCCCMVITDSGGLQEEASYLRKKCIVCRTTTERPEGLNVFSFLCDKPNKLESMFNSIIKYNIPAVDKCPYGDGNTAEKVVNILRENVL